MPPIENGPGTRKNKLFIFIRLLAITNLTFFLIKWLSGRVLDSIRGVAGSSLTGITMVCP